MPKSHKIAFLFPGQGAQYPGMGKDFFENFALARETFEEADDGLGRKLSTIILNGPTDILTETKNSQTGIYVTSIAILRVLSHLYPNLHPAICAGLSLGEYTALTATGMMSFSDGLPLVQYRGQYMNEACEAFPGTMAVVLGLNAEQVEQLVKDINLPNDVWAANFNCPGQVVISGTHKGIEAAAAKAKSVGAKRVLPLQVHGAFHSGLMKQAEDKLEDHVMRTLINPSAIELVMNVPGDFVKETDRIKRNLLKQVTSPVRWEQGVRRMIDTNVDLFIEIGCGKTLSGFNKRISESVPTISIEKISDLDLISTIL
jgi:[acyl-carrier-protein] S-malonyltransferase